jgi:hypothetical protein
MISFVDGYYGYLGNQMFGYAATRALAAHHGVECGWPGDKRPNLYEFFPLGSRRECHGTKVYAEQQFHFDPTFFDLPDGTILSGYFQSERYFKSIEGLIRAEFDFGTRAPGVDAVSVHVRRGDYLSFPEHHPPCSVDYYAEAMARFPGERFMVFSDDPGWCLLNLKPLGNVDIVTGRAAAEDMELMSRCKAGHVIANSSFSWWGAWLDPNPDKRVIAPRAWFGPAKAGWDTRDLIPEGWQTL